MNDYRRRATVFFSVTGLLQLVGSLIGYLVAPYLLFSFIAALGIGSGCLIAMIMIENSLTKGSEGDS